MRQRAIKLAKPVAVTAAIGFAYYLLHELTGFALFCPFRRFLNIYCPGCGVSRMFFHLFKLEFADAFSSNCVLFCLLPIALIELIYHGYRYIRYGSGKLNKVETIGVYVVIGILIVFGVARNIWQVDCLVP